MGGFEHYRDEIAALDREILYNASLCGVDIADHAAIHACLAWHREGHAADKARETLEGLLVLRLKIEAEMLRLGLPPPELGGW